MKAEPERIIVQLSEKEERELRTHDTYHGRRVSSWTMVMYGSAAGTQTELVLAPLSPKQAGRFEHIIRVLNMIEVDELAVIDGMAEGGWELCGVTQCGHQSKLYFKRPVLKLAD